MKMVRTQFNNSNKGGTKMACCEDKVDRLIANKQTRFTADDKEFLMGLEESQLDKLSPMEPEAPPKKKEEPQVNKEEVVEEFKAGLKTIEDYTSLMPEEMKGQVEGGVKLYKEHRESLVKGIMDNTKDNFSQEQLVAMDDSTLESIFKSVKPVDYSAQSGSGILDNGEDDDDILYPAAVYATADKKEED
jgi:hypothetical protein